MCREIPNLDHDRTRSIFITWPADGGPCLPMDSSLVNKAVQRIWARGPVEKKISATRIRKATTTAVRCAYPETREVLAKHMSHSAETADRHYALHNQQKMARPIGKLIENVMVNEQFSIDKSVHWPKQKPAILALPSSETKEEEKTEHSDDIVDYDVPSPLNENNLISSPDEESDDAWKQKSTKVIAKNTYHKRRSFAEEDAATLIRLCEGNLKSDNVKKCQIMTTLQSTDKGKCLILKLKESLQVPNFWKVIVDRIHAERRRRKRQN